jgi:hypothetical protein
MLGSKSLGIQLLRTQSALTLCAVLVSMALANVVRADDMIDNPAYQKWAKYNKGTSVTYSTDSTAMGNTSTITTTTTLTDLTPDKATISVASSMMVGGNKMDMPAQSQDIPAKIKKPADSTGAQPADAPKTDSTKEDVQAAGKTFSCTKTTVTTDQNGMTSKATTWTCDDVPNGIVKMEAETSGAMSSTTKMVLTAMDVK